MSKSILAAFDMGTNNFGFAVFNGKNQIAGGLFPFAIKSLLDNDREKQFKKFVRQMKKFIDKYKLDIIVMERYQNRGRFRGKGIELINIMIGIIMTLANQKRIKTELITAATWKNNYNKTFNSDLKYLYKDYKKVPPHLLDAHLQGWYILNQDKRFAYSTWTPKKLSYLKSIYK